MTAGSPPNAPPGFRPSALMRGRWQSLKIPAWITLAVCAVALAARRPTEMKLPQFWAEDGLIFFTDAHNAGLKVIFSEYAGYLHLVPRCIAALSVCFDAVHAPTVFIAASFALTLYVAARTLSPRFPFPGR